MEAYDTEARAVMLRNMIIVDGGVGIAVDGEAAESSRYVDLGYSNVWNNVNDYLGNVVLGPGQFGAR